MAESADATDLKSVGGDTVRVRPPLAPQTAYKSLCHSAHKRTQVCCFQSTMDFLTARKAGEQFRKRGRVRLSIPHGNVARIGRRLRLNQRPP